MTKSITIDSGNEPQIDRLASSCVVDDDDWRLLERRDVIFMRNIFRCSICHLMQQVGAGITEANLHVVVSDGRLVVTEVDNFHQPGRILSGIRIADYPGGTMFRLLAMLPTNADPMRHVQAEGIAMLTWGTGVKRLQATGVANGMTNSHGCIIDAVESTPY